MIHIKYISFNIDGFLWAHSMIQQRRIQYCILRQEIDVMSYIPKLMSGLNITSTPYLTIQYCIRRCVHKMRGYDITSTPYLMIQYCILRCVYIMRGYEITSISYLKIQYCIRRCVHIMRGYDITSIAYTLRYNTVYGVVCT